MTPFFSKLSSSGGSKLKFKSLASSLASSFKLKSKHDRISSPVLISQGQSEAAVMVSLRCWSVRGHPALRARTLREKAGS